MAKKKSIITDDLEHCFRCGRPYPEIHHVIFGTANRKNSDKYGMILPLCHEHHRNGRDSPHRTRLVDVHYKRLAQKAFENKVGSREDFIRIFGKSYLDDDSLFYTEQYSDL